MIVAIHQPEHLPWLGFLDKAKQADCFVILDNVQFRKNYYQNRNKIRTSSGCAWVSVPVKKHKLRTKINEIEINNSHKWQEKYFKTICYTYSRSPFFVKYKPYFETLLQKHWGRLIDLNIEIIRYLFKVFNIDIGLVSASSLENLRGDREDLLISICKELGAKKYLSGISGKEYFSDEKFAAQKIKVIYQEFYHPIYNQLYEPFIPCMSSIDLLFLYGEDARTILFGDKVDRLPYLIP